MKKYTAKSSSLDEEMKNEQKVNILMVDDRPENLLALEAVLACEAYRLVAANSGEEALKCLLKEDFAVILLDVQMPGLNGFETAKLIKAREKSKHIPIIFITAISQATEHVLKGYSAGAIDYIFKPIHPETLKLKIEGFVKLHQNRQQIQLQNDLLRRRALELEEMNNKLNRTTSELRKAEALARVIGETSIDTIVTFDEKGRVLTVNPAVEEMFGYTARELPGRCVSNLLPALNGERQELGKIVETEALRKDGSRFPVDIQIGKASIEAQQIFICSIRDITERKQMEKERKEQFTLLEKLVEERTLELLLANEKLQKEIHERNKIADQLRKSNRQIESILESISDAFYAVDKNWCFTYVNREAERHLGKSRKELIGKNLWEYMDFCKEFYKAVEQQIPVHFETSPDSKSWLEVHAYPSETGLSVYFRDITKRKQMEQDLRLSQERFRKIFDCSPCLIAIISLHDFRYIDVNESWLHYTGYRYEEVQDQACSLPITAESDEGHAEALCLQSEAFIRSKKICYLTKHGEKRKGLLSTETIEIQGEQCILCVITDITEMELLEREMARLDRLNLVGEMAAGIAHEIRNPMTTVRGFLQMSRYNPLPEYIDLMVEELDRANSIITEYLSLAKNKTTDRKWHNLNSIIDALFPLIQAEATLSGKSVHLELGESAQLLLDEKEIRQLILNFALNGLEAMGAGGRLTIKTYTDLQEVILEIQDQGSGIKEELLEKLGTPFFTTKQNGTGLGLAVCYSVASRHNAVIEVKTSERGTTFRVRFRS